MITEELNENDFLIPSSQACKFLDVATNTILYNKKYNFHLKRIKKDGDYFFNLNQLIKFKELRDDKKPKKPKSKNVTPLLNVDERMQYKWDVALITAFFNDVSKPIYRLAHDFYEKNGLPCDYNQQVLRRTPFCNFAYVRSYCDVYEFIATRLPKLFKALCNKDITDVFDIAESLKKSSLDCIQPTETAHGKIASEAKKQDRINKERLKIQMEYKDNYNKGHSIPGLKNKRMKI